MTEVSSSLHRRRVRKRSGSRFENWLSRLRKSKRARRKLLHLTILVATVLFAFAIGFYYFGPSFTFSGDE